MRDRIDALFSAFERLSSREQSLLLLVIVVLFGGIVGFGSFFVSRGINQQEKRIEAKLAQLQEIAELRADYQNRLREQQRLTNEVRANASTRILSLVEKIAQENGIELENASERPGQPTGSDVVREESAKVTVNEVSIDRLDAFLRSLDGNNRLVQIRGLRVTPNYENPKRLNATITVGTFKAVGSADVLRIVGYVAFFLASFVVCLYLTFPWRTVKQRVLQAASKSLAAKITAESLEPSWLTGVHAEKVEIELGGGDDPLALERLDARANVMDFLFGGYGGTVEVPVAQGLLNADVSASEEEMEVEAEIRQVELALLPALKDATGLALSGTLDGSADLMLGLAAPEKSQGTIELSASGLETLEGGKAGQYPIPALEVGDFAWTLPVENGKVIVRNQRISGPNVEVSLDGEIVLGKPLSRSLVNVTVKFRPTDVFLKKEPLFASLLKNIDRYKASDGFYVYQLSGTVKRPRMTPKPR